MSVQSILNSRYGVGMALGLGRILAPGPGYLLADILGKWIADLRKLQIVRTVRANQWVIHGGRLAPRELDGITRRVFQKNNRCLYDHYHTLSDPRATLKMVSFSPQAEQAFARIRSGKAGTLFACPHLSNFDLMGRALGLIGLDIQVLSVPQPPSGYRWQNHLRSQVGLEVTPVTPAAMRQAGQRLKQGGVVLTGIDRPTGDSKYKVRFFCREASLPVYHVRLALNAGVSVTLVAARTQPDGSYHLLASEPIPMQPAQDLHEEIVTNAERVLAITEKWIVDQPEQWSMFFPVWPEALDEISAR